MHFFWQNEAKFFLKVQCLSGTLTPETGARAPVK
jgi:hypothetical protein